MRRLLPSRMETAIFAAVALICAVIAVTGAAPDIRLAILAMPLFVVAAMMGMRRHQKLARVAQESRRVIERD